MDKFPFLDRAKIQPCDEADRKHRQRWRWFFHTNCKGKLTVCFARAAEKELTDAELMGLELHELGHIVAGHTNPPGTPDDMQMEADVAMVKALRLKTYTYNNRELESVDPMEIARKFDRLI